MLQVMNDTIQEVLTVSATQGQDMSYFQGLRLHRQDKEGD